MGWEVVTVIVNSVVLLLSLIFSFFEIHINIVYLIYYVMMINFIVYLVVTDIFMGIDIIRYYIIAGILYYILDYITGDLLTFNYTSPLLSRFILSLAGLLYLKNYLYSKVFRNWQGDNNWESLSILGNCIFLLMILSVTFVFILLPLNTLPFLDLKPFLLDNTLNKVDFITFSIVGCFLILEKITGKNKRI